MEYLTLHDIPQRHMYSARRMATPDELRGSERTLPALPVVCDTSYSYSPTRPPPSVLFDSNKPSVMANHSTAPFSTAPFSTAPFSTVPSWTAPFSNALSSNTPFSNALSSNTPFSNALSSNAPSSTAPSSTAPSPTAPSSTTPAAPGLHSPTAPSPDENSSSTWGAPCFLASHKLDHVKSPAQFLEPPSNFSPKRVFPHWLTPSTLAPTVRIPTENWSGSVSKLSTTSVKLPPITEDRRRQRLDSLAPVYSHSLATDMAQGNYSNDDLPQNNLTRHSPPVQPNERQPSSVGLPSFSQLLKNVHSEPSPPRTPNRSNGSNDSSPVGHSTQWDDVVWGGDSKRRRLDSSDGQYRPAYPAESLDYEPRRPSAIDPTLGEPYGQTYHRPSLPFVPQSASMATHVRHQSSPIPQGNTQYQNHAAPTHHSVSGPSGYSVHAGQYDRQPSYYPEPHPSAHAHAYERAPSNAYYVPSLAYMTNGAYNPHAPPQSYNSYTFQSSLGVDQSSFNRKRRGNLPKEATAILKKWFADHRDSPYPTEEEKLALCQKCQLTLNQVSNWFINARRRAPGREQRDARENTENLG